ncbi:hypothetical protein D6D13_00049 [Aureobasidium pullulans]|uniref:Transmembrane protein n=1 Tax=Aureobasidium pullulans TaxID=5580 RepID=A0A4S9DFV3_AURPU|nr:hypothetical protein D6D13_00049 [Aureobasidium pullulans]
MSSTNFESDCVFVDNADSDVSFATTTTTDEMPFVNSTSTTEMSDAGSALFTETQAAEAIYQLREVARKASAELVRAEGICIALQTVPTDLQHRFEKQQVAAEKAHSKSKSSGDTPSTEELMRRLRQQQELIASMQRKTRAGEGKSRAYCHRQSDAKKASPPRKSAATLETSITDLSVLDASIQVAKKSPILSSLAAVKTSTKAHVSSILDRDLYSRLSTHGKRIYITQFTSCLILDILFFVSIYVPSIRTRSYCVIEMIWACVSLGMFAMIWAVEKLGEKTVDRYGAALFRASLRMIVLFPQTMAGMHVLSWLNPFSAHAFPYDFGDQVVKVWMQNAFVAAYLCMLIVSAVKTELAKLDAAEEKAEAKVG